MINHSSTSAALAILTLTGGARTTEEPRPKVERSEVVFVCEHGTVKSVIAMQLFNQLARERGLSVRAISRGITPDTSVPARIAEQLAEDGLRLVNFKPRAFSRSDLKGATLVVAIGAETSAVTHGTDARVESWNDVPPASENYAASRDAMKKRIEGLLTSLPAAKPRTERKTKAGAVESPP